MVRLVLQVRLDLALCLHHDAITGTSQPSVVEDYTARMVAGAGSAFGVLSDMASLLLGGLPRALHEHPALPAACTGAAAAAPSAGLSCLVDLSAVATLDPAPLTHIAHVLPVLAALPVPPTADGVWGADTPAHPVVVNNPSAWRRRAAVSVVLDASALGLPAAARDTCGQKWPFAVVTDASGAPVPSQWVAVVIDTAASEIALAQVVGGGTAPAAPVVADMGSLRTLDAPADGRLAQVGGRQQLFAVLTSAHSPASHARPFASLRRRATSSPSRQTSRASASQRTL